MERRRARRFSLHLPLEVTRTASGRMLLAGSTRNISSAGVLFTCDSELPSGPIEYTVTLDADSGTKVMIRCIGNIVRMERPEEEGSANRIAATLERYEFLRSGT